MSEHTHDAAPVEAAAVLPQAAPALAVAPYSAALAAGPDRVTLEGEPKIEDA